MARKSPDANEEPAFGRRDVNRLTLVLVGATLLFAATITPWWTRGITMDYDSEDNPRPFGEAYEGIYVQYRPFATPASLAGFSTDGQRETATAILGVSLVLCGLFASATTALRLGMRFGKVETDHDLPVRFAMTAFILGLFAVLWGAFFLPLLGPNPGWLYGDEGELPEDFDEGDLQGTKATRFANVGFFLGIAGAVGYPAALWFDASRTRALAWGDAGLGAPVGTMA
ncbi:MAG: hypothetical protein AABY18_06380 [Candidatus Thermoplasmatota archaeon]